jgi:signal transduction histidine kinase
VVRATGSLPDSKAAQDPVLATAGWESADAGRDPMELPSLAGQPVLAEADKASGWQSLPGWLDVTWVLLWLLSLAGVIVFQHWQAVPFLAILLVVMMWHNHRRQAANAERVRVSEENERLLATQQRFLQDASHQLRTPITIALGHSELLARSLADADDRRDIKVVVGELNRLRKLSERLLLIAASENPNFLQPEPVELRRMALEVVRRWRPTAERHWQVGRLERATAIADRERLWLAVDALMENAIQHTSPGDVIRLSVLRDGDFARLVVTDTGTGIAPLELASIFERFATGADSRGRRGTGLGLALVRAVARGHGGETRVRSVLGQGSTFELVLPVRARDRVPDGPIMATLPDDSQGGSPRGAI